MSTIERTLRALGVDENSLEGKLLAAEMGTRIADRMFAEAGIASAQFVAVDNRPRLAAGTNSGASAVEPIACVLVSGESGEPISGARCEHRDARLHLVVPGTLATGRPASDVVGIRVAGVEHRIGHPSFMASGVTWILPRSLRRNMLATLERTNGVVVLEAILA